MMIIITSCMRAEQQNAGARQTSLNRVSDGIVYRCAIHKTNIQHIRDVAQSRVPVASDKIIKLFSKKRFEK